LRFGTCTGRGGIWWKWFWMVNEPHEMRDTKTHVKIEKIICGTKKLHVRLHKTLHYTFLPT